MRWLFVIALLLLITNHLAHGLSMYEKIGQLLTNLFLTLTSSYPWIRDTFLFERAELPDSNVPNYSHYDYVIVGAGSAGAALAARLTEIPYIKVLLIEAGGPENYMMDIPAASLGLHFVNSLNYDYRTENTGEYCRAMDNGQCFWPMGRVTGGNSAFNFMVATRGHQKDYDDWAQQTGDSSWGYSSMLKYFKKLENFNVQGIANDSVYHNYAGPIHISRSDFVSPFASSFVQAGKEVFGLPSVDYNGANMNGFSLMQSTLRNNERWSANRGYLQPARYRPNLHITRNSRVFKLLIRNSTAYGVRYMKNNKEYEVYADLEVIVTAGTMETPKLLMLSGIGPCDHLNQMKIPCIKNLLGVGDYLLDHPGYSGLVFLVKKGTGLVTSRLRPSDVENYSINRRGPLANPIFNALGFVNTKNSSLKTERPDIELLYSSANLVQDNFAHRIFGISKKYFNEFYGNILERDAFQIWPILLKPKSKGKLLLRSANPNDKPRLVANYLQEREDMQTLIKGIRMTIEIGKAQVMKKHETRLHDKLVPGCESFGYDSDRYWECALRTFVISCNHHVGTCKMGRIEDPLSVVDPELRVIGINNLRIGDASVMPSIPAAHVNLPTLAVAEKLSDMIKGEVQEIKDVYIRRIKNVQEMKEHNLST